MNRTTVATPVAVLALVVSLGSTSQAGSLLTGKDIKNESITGRDVKRLTGADVQEHTLGTVPRAASARTADAVGGLRPRKLLTTDGCQTGTVKAQVTVNGADDSMPATYTSSAAYLSSRHNCTGGKVQVRRKSQGWYYVKFQGNPGDVATVQVLVEPKALSACALVQKVPVVPTSDSHAFNVLTFECAKTHTTDLSFSLVVT